MSYEVIDVTEIPCPCGRGKIKRITKENDWLQRKETVTIECPACSAKYTISREEHMTKPYHGFTVYYAMPAGGIGEPIKLDL